MWVAANLTDCVSPEDRPRDICKSKFDFVTFIPDQTISWALGQIAIFTTNLKF